MLSDAVTFLSMIWNTDENTTAVDLRTGLESHATIQQGIDVPHHAMYWWSDHDVANPSASSVANSIVHARESFLYLCVNGLLDLGIDLFSLL